MPKLKKTTPESIVIIGMGPSFADYHNETSTQDRKEDIADEIWGINAACFDHRVDRAWWMDDLKKEREVRQYTIDRLDWLDVPVITSVAYPKIVEKSETYPINEACRLSMDVFNKIYLNNTISYAIAYAILMQVKRISLYGCDFTYINRNFAESGRACLESWIVTYQALGGDVKLAPNSHLFDNCGRVDGAGRTVGFELYGYDVQPVIDLGDGKTICFAKSEQQQINDRVLALMNDGPRKNAPEMESLDLQLQMLHLEGELQKIAEAKNGVENTLTSLKLKEVENAVRNAEPGTSSAGTGSIHDGAAGHDAQAGDPLPGGSLRSGGNGRQPSQEGPDAADAERGDAGGVQGNPGEAVAAGESAVPVQPGEVAGGSAE